MLIDLGPQQISWHLAAKYSCGALVGHSLCKREALELTATSPRSSIKQATPFRLLDLPVEIRIMIYHFAMGNQYIHIYSNCDRIPAKIIQCNDEESHSCLESKLSQDNLCFQFGLQHPLAMLERDDEVVHCRGSVLFHNRICTSREIKVGDPDGYWSLSVSQDVRTGLETLEYGTRNNPNSNNANLSDYCPCIHSAKTSLSLNLLQTCKQIHKEAALIPCSSNTFIFQDMETFTAFFGLILPEESDSEDSLAFVSDLSNAICNMRHIRLYTRAAINRHLRFINRLLRASLSLLTGLHTFELTLGLLPVHNSHWEIEDILAGVSRSIRKVTINIGDQMWMAREWHVHFPALCREKNVFVVNPKKSEVLWKNSLSE